MKINSNLRSIQNGISLEPLGNVNNTPKILDNSKHESSAYSFLKDSSDFISDKLIKIGDWWREKKSVNNETTKRSLEDTETLLEMLKNTTGKITYAATNGLVKVANATTSVLDVTESYSNDIKNNRKNLPETLNTIVKGTSQSVVGGIVTTGVISTLSVGAGIATLPLVVGGVAGGIAAYGFGKVYDYFSPF